MSLARRLQHARQMRSLQARFAAGDWCRELPDECWHLVSQRPTAAGLRLYVDVLHCLRGISEQDLAKVFGLCQEADIRDASVFLRLLACAQRLGSAMGGKTMASLRRRCVLAGSRFGHAYSDYPLLLASLEEWEESRSLLTRHEVGLLPVARELQGRWTESPALLAAQTDTSTRTIAVVGNGPSLLAHALGEAIDASDLVIRFNRVVLLPSMQMYTGKRTDLWVMNPSTPIDCLPADAESLAISGAPLFVRPSRFWRSAIAGCRLPVSGLEPLAWYELVKVLQAPPSAGLLMLESLRVVLPDATVTAHGFSTEREHESANHYADRNPASKRHNWQAEARWLRNYDTAGRQIT